MVVRQGNRDQASSPLQRTTDAEAQGLGVSLNPWTLELETSADLAGARTGAGPPQPLFKGRFTHWYDVTPDGRHFVMFARQSAEITKLNVVLNWSAELERLVPTK